MNRVLVLIKGLGRGGAEQILVSSAAHADRSRWEYEVAYLLPHKNALVPELIRSGVRVHELGYGPSWVARLHALVDGRGMDLVHAHSPVPAIAARVVRRRSRPRLVYTEHNVWQRYHSATYWANAVTFGRNDHVFAVADHVRQSIRYPVPLRHRSMPTIETMHYGIDPRMIPDPAPRSAVLDELGIPSDSRVIGTVANFKAHKAHHHLLEAALLVRRAVPEARFVLVGHGPLLSSVRRQAKDLGLDGTVVFAGYREDPMRLVGAFDLFVLSSVYEGLSIALLEAMALGRPPVVTAVGGLPEVVEDGVNGMLVPPAQPSEMADAITMLLRDDALRDRLGDAARQRALQFDIRDAVRRTEQVYEELLS